MYEWISKNIAVYLIVAVLSLIPCALSGCGDQGYTEAEENTSQTVSSKQIAEAVEECIKSRAAANNGIFIAKDEKTGETLELMLKKVYTKTSGKVGDNQYFACAEFVARDGEVYDLDVYVEGKKPESLRFTKFSIHKKGGVERYTWFEVDGICRKKMIE